MTAASTTTLAFSCMLAWAIVWIVRSVASQPRILSSGCKELLLTFELPSYFPTPRKWEAVQFFVEWEVLFLFRELIARAKHGLRIAWSHAILAPTGHGASDSLIPKNGISVRSGKK